MPIQSPHLFAVALLQGTLALQAARLNAFPGPLGLDLISTLLIVAIVLASGIVAEQFIFKRKPSGVASPLTLSVWTPLFAGLFVVLVWYMFDALQEGQIHNLIPRRRHVSQAMKHFWLRSNPAQYWTSFAILAFFVWIAEGALIRCMKASHRLWTHRRP